MNKIYRIVWSTATSTWVVASEFAKGDARGAAMQCPPVRRRCLASIIAMLLGCAHPAWAQTVFWDGTNTTVNADGGAGTWQTGTTNWDDAATGGANTAWSDALDAVFGGSAGTVTIAAGGVSAHNLTFNPTNYVITGGTLTLSGTDPTITVNGTQATIASIIAGSNGLTKSGAGNLQFNGANTYTGVTRVTGGALLLNNAAALGGAGNDAANLVLSPGTRLDFFNATYARNFTASGTISIGGSGATWSGVPTLTADTTLSFVGSNTFTGNFSDNGAVLSLTNGGNNTFSGTNTYSGVTRLTGGFLTPSGASSLSANSNLQFDSATNAFLVLRGDFDRTLGTGANQVRWTSSGGFLSNTTGLKTVDLGGPLAWGTTPNFLPTSATLDIGATSGAIDFVNPIALPNAGTSYVVHAVGTLGSHATLSGTLSGAGNLFVTGSVTGISTSFLELAGANTFSGRLILGGTEGHVMLSHAQALPDTAGLELAGGGSSLSNTLVLTANSGDFTRALGTGANQVRWTGNGGFSAAGGARVVNIGAGAALRWNTGGFVPTNNWLVLATAGDSEIEFRNAIDLDGATRTIAFGTGGQARLTGVLSNGGVLYRGSGTGRVEGTNTYTGTTTIGVNGTSSTTVSVSSIGNGGSAGNLGAASNAAGNLVLASGTINYTGAGETTDRNVTVAAGNGTLQGNGTGGITWAGVTSAVGANTLFLGGSAASTVVNRVGTVGNGTGTLSVDKTGTGTWRLEGANTYTGVTRVSAGVLEVSNLGNGGGASGLGASSSAAANLVGNGGTLRYVGATDASTDRSFQLANAFRLESSGAGSVRWTSTSPIQIVATSPTLTLAGSNAGHNAIAAALLNHATANNVNQIRTGLTKTGTGTWWIEGTGAGYTGNTTITDGTLVGATNSGINGGFGTTSNSVVASGYTSTNAASSLILFNGTGTEGGVLALTADSGAFTRGLTTAAQSFNSNGTPTTGDDSFIHGVRWTGHGGFAAMDGTQVVNIGGSGATLGWNSNGFVPTGSNLILGSAAGNGTVDFRNGIALVNGARTIETRDGSAAVDAILSGMLSSGGSSGQLAKTGAGTLALTGNNTALSGNTNIQAGTLQIGNGGTSGSIGTSVATVAAGATLSINRSDALTFTNNLGGAGTLRQAGTGTTTFNVTRTIGGVEVLAGTLDLDQGITTQTLLMGAGTLRVGGTMQASGDPRIALSAVAGTVSTIDIESGATLQANGSLGDGNDVLRVAGTLASTTGVSMGDGDDTFEIVDGGASPELDGGAGNDTVNANIATTADVAALKAFESLDKTGAGTLRFTGATTSDIANIDIAAGTLSVLLGATVGGPATGSNAVVRAGATLDIAAGGAFGCGDGSDALTVAGTVAGAGTLDQCDGDDVLRLDDGASITLAEIEGGGHVTGDRLVVANAAAMTVDAVRVSGYELFEKQGGGTVTLSGAHAYTGGATQAAGAVDIAGTFDAATYAMTSATTLRISGTARNGAGAMSISGDNAAQAIDIAGGTLHATGNLGGGDDILTLRDGATLAGAGILDGGAQSIADTIALDFANAQAFGAANVTGFEILSKSNTGDATLTGTQAYATRVDLQAGTLSVAGTLAAPQIVMNAGSTFAVRAGGHAEGTAGTAASLAGTSGIETVVIEVGATLIANGDLGNGNDILDVAGTLDTDGGTLLLGAGDDEVRVYDTTDLQDAIVDAGAGNDLLDIDLGTGTTVAIGATAGFESLGKSGLGTMRADGANSFVAVRVEEGMVDIAATGSVQATALDLFAGATLQVDGALRGTNAADTFAIAGEVNGAGVFDLGLGDDTLTLGDGADLGGFTGAIEGGGGIDTVAVNIAGSARLGDSSGFEQLRKQGVGTLSVVNDAAFDSVALDAGTLRIDAGASIAGSGTPFTAAVAANATLDLSGDFGCNAGNDTITVAGAVTGAGALQQCGGDDTLVLRDGADFTAFTGTIDGGANGAGGDILQLDIATTRAFGGDAENYEVLRKTGTGTATLTGAMTFATRAAIDAGTLKVDDTLEAPAFALSGGATLGVGGNATGLAGAHATISGDAGTNSVIVDASGTLRTNGSLGDGGDLLDLAGTLDTGVVALSLGDGSDTFTLHDDAVLIGIVDGGAGIDTFNTDIATTAQLGAATGFEALDKTGAGTLQITGLAVSEFQSVAVSAGTLGIAGNGAISGATNTQVDAGARLQVDGAYSGSVGADTMTVAGTVAGTGSIALAAGADTLTLQAGNALLAMIDGGADDDRVVLDASAAMTFDAAGVANFETLAKQGAADATVTGDGAFAATAIDAGTLRVAGTLQTQSTGIADGATLQVDGVVTTAAFAPAAGDATVIVSDGGTLNAAGDLGDGADTLELAGTLDTVGGVFSLGAGDDTFTLHDGADAGDVDGGAGSDTLNTHIVTNAQLGAATGFEALAKSGAGTLTVAGPAVSQFDRVAVDAGTLAIAADGTLRANGAGFDTTVAAGATLRVEGTYAGSAGEDTMTVAGTVAGTGTIALGDGDDVLVLRDGAVLANVIDGGLPTASDSVVLDTAGTLDFNAAQTVNFETLRKLGLGLANVIGDAAFTTVQLDAGTLAVQGALSANLFNLADATTLRIDGQSIGTIAGSAGVNTIVVGASGAFIGGGDLGAGDDVLDVAGRLDTETSAVHLGDGDDRLVVHDTTAIVGAGGIDAGAGNDTLGVDVGAGNLVPLPGLAGFESLAKLGQGTLQLDGLSAFIDVTAAEGLLHVAGGGALSAQRLVVERAGTLRLDGGFAGTAGDDIASIAGTVAGAAAFTLGDGDDTLVLLDGANLSALAAPLDGGAGADTLQTDIATTASLAAAVNFEGLAKTNIGTLHIDGPATTVFDTVDVQGGTLAIGAAGRVEGATATTVAQGATMQVDGAFAGSAGDDLFFLAGRLQGGGNVALGAGRDTLQLTEGATFDTRVDGGDDSDSIVAEIATTATLGPVAQFESLQKHGVGTLLVAAPQSFDITDVHAGTLAVGADATYRSQATTVAADATLDVAGRFTGTEGDDTFASSGIVRGAFDFAAGNDRVFFTGGPNPPLQLDGGSGNDTLTFDGMDLGDAHVGQLQGWELVSLEHGTSLTLSTAIAGVDMLALDASSSIFARDGASLSGTLSSDGAVHVDAARMAIGGGYAAGPNASLFVTVSPGSNTAGGLDIAGDVTGVTPVVFASDGSTGGSTASILVIDSPNDARGNGGFTVAGSDDGMLRLQGSPFAWTFGQADDNRWYLDTDATVVMPEVAGYATLAAIGFDTTRTAQQALFGHLDGVRGSVDCDRDGGRNDGSHRFERKDCSGFWVSTIGTETRVGAGPGFAYSGDTYGLFVGADGTVHEDDAREIRVGAFAGMVEGNWWTTGASSGPIAASDANVRLEGPAFGAYGELLWSNGTYASTSIVQQRHDADVIASDGFRQHIDGSSASLVQQLGWKRAVENGWSLEPQLQLGVTKQQWHDVVDASGKALTLHDDTLGHVRAALRVDRTVAGHGGTWRPWFSAGLEDTFGESASSVSVSSVALPGEQVGQRWTFDAGVEATLHNGVTLFGALGLANELNGTSKETRQARVGVRWSW